MKDKDKLTHKLGIIIPIDLYNRLSRCFEWGERTRVITRILEWTCEKVEKHGKEALIVFLREGDLSELVCMGVGVDVGNGIEDKKEATTNGNN